MEHANNAIDGGRIAGIMEQNPDPDTLGGRLSRAREATGMSTAQLARRLGVRTATLQSWETDRSEPRSNRLAMLAGVLNVSPSWLLGGVGTPPPEDSRSQLIRSIGRHLNEIRNLQQRTAQAISNLEREIVRFENEGPAARP